MHGSCCPDPCNPLIRDAPNYANSATRSGRPHFPDRLMDTETVITPGLLAAGMCCVARAVFSLPPSKHCRRGWGEGVADVPPCQPIAKALRVGELL